MCPNTAWKDYPPRLYRRPDLCHLTSDSLGGVQAKRALSVFYVPDLGSVIRRSVGWYATNDTRACLAGVVPNSELTQPTSGPHPTLRDAWEALWARQYMKEDAGD